MDVSQLLAEEAEKASSIEATLHPKRDDDYMIDVGHMAVFDPRPVPYLDEAVLKSLCRENVQLLLNEIWTLPVAREDDGVFATLPECTTRLPRAKPLPQAKAPTRWEKYAAQKGILNKKKDRMVYDEITQEYRPRFGYRKANDMESLPWLEVPDSADPFEDQFAKLREEKKARVQKNVANRVRNLAAARLTGGKKDRALAPDRPVMKAKLTEALVKSKKSTASAGVFDAKLANEPRVKGVKRKRESVTMAASAEQARVKAILDRITKKDVTIATKTGVVSAEHRTRASTIERGNFKMKKANRQKGRKPGKMASGKRFK